MNRSIRDLVTCAILATCLIPAALVRADERADLARQIAQRIETLAELRAQRRRATEVHTQRVDSGERVIRSLEADLSTVVPELTAQNEAIATLEAGAEAKREVVRRSTQWIDRIGDWVGKASEGFAQRIAQGVPIDRDERREPFGDAAVVLTDGSARDHDEAAAAISTLFERAGDEVMLGRSVELANVPIVFDGGDRRVHAWRLRIGLVNAAFVSEDGVTRGVWAGPSRDGDGPWRIDLTSDEAAEVDELLDVSRERRPPAFVPMRFPAATPEAGSDGP